MVLTGHRNAKSIQSGIVIQQGIVSYRTEKNHDVFSSLFNTIV